MSIQHFKNQPPIVSSVPLLSTDGGEPCLHREGLVALLGCKRQHVTNQLVKRPDFPAPCISTSSRRIYWRAIDVLQWLNGPGTRALSLAELDAPRLDTQGIADLLGCTRQHAAAVITKRLDFPAPCINLSSRARFWLAVDVRQWLLRPSMCEASVMDMATARLDTGGIALLLGCPREYVTSQVARRPDFPAPHIEVSRRLRYWRKADVLTWMQKGGAA